MPTLKEIAEKANVSVATVSYVLNGKDNVKDSTKALILQTAADLEKQSVQEEHLGKGKVQTGGLIGVIVEDFCVFNTPEIIRGICTEAQKTGVNVIMNHLNLIELSGGKGPDELLAVKKAREAVTLLLSRNVEGIIYVGCKGRDVRNIASEYNIPIVFSYCFSSETGTVSVTYKDEDTAYELAMHLVENKHSNIGIVAGPEDYIHVRSRIAGFQRAMYDAGILFNLNNVIFGDWDSPQLGYNAMETLAKNGVTAVFCLNDTAASGVVEYARIHGIRIPEKLSITGFDSIEDDKFMYRRLTSVHLPLEEIGRKSFEQIYRLVTKKCKTEQPVIIYIKSKIDYRDTVALAGSK